MKPSSLKGKITLQKQFPDFPLMTVRECLDHLGWKYTPTEDGAKDIKCCGSMVTMGGWVGTEHAWCPKCHKGMQDLTGILPHPAMNEGAGVCQHIDFDKTIIPRNGCVWTPKNIWGY